MYVQGSCRRYRQLDLLPFLHHLIPQVLVLSPE